MKTTGVRQPKGALSALVRGAKGECYHVTDNRAPIATIRAVEAGTVPGAAAFRLSTRVDERQPDGAFGCERPDGGDTYKTRVVATVVLGENALFVGQGLACSTETARSSSASQ